MTTNLVPSSNQATSPANAATAALANALQVKRGLGVLYGVTGYSTAAQFIQLHDLSAAPDAGAAPKFAIPIAANAPFSIDFGVYGMFFPTGIRVVNSTTGPTYTAGSADTFIADRYA